jgi:hypothetical protein
VTYRGKEIELRIIEKATTTGKRKRAGEHAQGEDHVALHHVVKLEQLMRGRSLSHNVALYRQILGEHATSQSQADRDKGQQLRDRVEPIVQRAMAAAARADRVVDGRTTVTTDGSGWAEVEVRNANRDLVLALSQSMNGAVWAPGDGTGAGLPSVQGGATTSTGEPPAQASNQPQLPGGCKWGAAPCAQLGG